DMSASSRVCVWPRRATTSFASILIRKKSAESCKVFHQFTNGDSRTCCSEIDLTYIRQAASQIGMALRDKATYHLVLVKSTVVPGTTDEVVRPVLEEASLKKAGVDFGVGMNPEFLTEGEAIQDFMHPDRIVLGGMDYETTYRLEQLYSV